MFVPSVICVASVSSSPYDHGVNGYYPRLKHSQTRNRTPNSLQQQTQEVPQHEHKRVSPGSHSRHRPTTPIINHHDPRHAEIDTRCDQRRANRQINQIQQEIGFREGVSMHEYPADIAADFHGEAHEEGHADAPGAVAEGEVDLREGDEGEDGEEESIARD